MIEYEVEFPNHKSFSLKIDGYEPLTGLSYRTIDAIGGDVKVLIEKQTLLTVPYREDITTDFTLEDYRQRAEKHAKGVLEKLISAAMNQTAVESNTNSILENVRQNLLANT